MPRHLETITQSKLYVEPWRNPATKRLPGVNLLNWNDWLLVDDAFARQMEYRDHLLTSNRDAVFDAKPCADAASEELLAKVCENLTYKHGYSVENDQVIRPDGAAIRLNKDHPLAVAGRLVQQDFCLLERGANEHVLRGAVLCFPSNWRLGDKMDRPMSAIHAPVQSYGAELGTRVQRIFDNIGETNPVWRANYLLYGTANLFQPDRERVVDRTSGKWVRVERQSLVYLPESKYLAFGIHTHIVPITTFSPDEKAAFLEAWANHKHYAVSG
ncbi:heme-dependent oxidative N-demethylase family protein [Neptunicoccus cionae]|uniref:DUF3445 domain-containing protein n=1 Tax=Neptunicoccus cionae TaxID=2035344 RepID=A0A916VNK9_9RHOB|nr:DUF3445 domain-containing protein [Amylibacter cionae]GGA11918.1 hypothetical protein GCM10011498_10170 [Amylibacter cionae]